MKALQYTIFFLFLLLFFTSERLCHKATDGFALVNIYAPKENSFLEKRQLPLGELEKKFEEPFYYLNSGSQSYVFLSSDGKTVLKFFKFQHMRIPPWIDALPLPSPLAEKRALKKEKKRNVLTRTLNSYHIAFEKMRDETGLLFVHLAPTAHLNKKVTIYDKIGKRHVIDLDLVEFVLQERATLVYDTIDTWIENGQHQKAEKGLRDLLRVALTRCQNGIFDKDPDFATNFGFVGDVPIQIDVGRFILDEKETSPLVYQDEMFRITRHFQEWIEKNHPDLLDSFDDEIEKITLRN